MNNFFYYIRRI